jgi:hypothetical protein
MTWTAIDLLEKVLEFTKMTKENEWDVKSLADNPPRLIRLQRINALLSAFCMIQQGFQKRNKNFSDNALQSLIHGDFIQSRALSDYTSVIAVIEERNRFNKSFLMDDLKDFYSHLVKYKTAVIREVLNFYSGYMEAPIGVIAAYQLSVETNRMIREQILPIDRLLASIISPGNRTFEEKVLIEKFNFPKDDLLDIDIDWM